MIFRQNELAQVTRAVQDHIYELDDLPLTLHHYTDAHGIKGIIESNSLRMTHAAYLNDASELAYARDAAERAINRHFTKRGGPDDVREGLIIHIRNRDNYITTAVTCFSREGNLLNQWRDYGGDQKYSLEFWTAGLVAGVNAYARLFPIIYDRAEQDRLADLYCDEVRAVLDQNSESSTNFTREDQQETINWVADGLAIVCSFFKDNAFLMENEYRLAWSGTYQAVSWDYRPSEYGLTPYLDRKYEEKMLPLKSVMVGPCRYPIHSKFSVSQFLSKSGHFVPVNSSLIPMRGK